MKIFNWVHRRFNHSHGMSENVVKKSDDEKQFLLEENDDVIGGFYGGWKGGILAIGTFGYNPLIANYNYDDDDDEDDHVDTNNGQITRSNLHGHDYDDKKELAFQENEDEDDDNDEVNPLMYAVYGGHDDCEGLMKGGGEVDEGFRVLCNGAKLDEYERIENVKRERERERTTLAELFSADSDDEGMMMMRKMKDEKKADGGEGMKQKSGGDKNAKKVVGGDNGHPTIHKFNRLMRRMLKRKIHPDINCSNSFPN